ncbi:MAG: PQQ-like beta-propeller repeat protein [Bdellovibrionaceae bacterium]|nr:PQQ-like beta-propeller repeat protein [Pseudobdellovibrionaceae bacterium]
MVKFYRGYAFMIALTLVYSAFYLPSRKEPGPLPFIRNENLFPGGGQGGIQGAASVSSSVGKRKKLWSVTALYSPPNRPFQALMADGNGVYVGNEAGHLQAYDLEGNRRWIFRSLFDPVGVTAQIFTSDDSVFFGSYSGRFYSLDKKTGETRWVFPARWPVKIVDRSRDGKILIASSSHRYQIEKFFQLDPVRGNPIEITKSEFESRRLNKMEVETGRPGMRPPDSRIVRAVEFQGYLFQLAESGELTAFR